MSAKRSSKYLKLSVMLFMPEIQPYILTCTVHIIVRDIVYCAQHLLHTVSFQRAERRYLTLSSKQPTSPEPLISIPEPLYFLLWQTCASAFFAFRATHCIARNDVNDSREEYSRKSYRKRHRMTDGWQSPPYPKSPPC